MRPPVAQTRTRGSISSEGLTNAQDDEHDEEGIGYWLQGRAEGKENPADLPGRTVRAVLADLQDEADA